jgi:hypothetical protein
MALWGHLYAISLNEVVPTTHENAIDSTPFLRVPFQSQTLQLMQVRDQIDEIAIVVCNGRERRLFAQCDPSQLCRQYQE